MKRQTITDAAGRVSAPGLPDLPADDGQEAVSLVVRGGEVIAVVPRSTPDAQIEASAQVVRGCLRLEDERVLTFQVQVGPGTTSFEDLHAQLHPDHAGAAAVSPAALTARDIMAREIVTVASDMLVEDAAKLLAYHNISGMPVEDPDGKIVGIVSEADVIGHIGAVVSEVMTEEVISVGENATVEEVATLMAEHRIKRVPVMENGSVRGMVSRSDIVRAIATPR
ncbi:MAG: CBS domain-containing protein [Chloroflexota bacterium]